MKITEEQFEEILDKLDIDLDDPIYEELNPELSNGGEIFIQKFQSKELDEKMYQGILGHSGFEDLIEEISKALAPQSEIKIEIENPEIPIQEEKLPEIQEDIDQRYTEEIRKLIYLLHQQYQNLNEIKTLCLRRKIHIGQFCQVLYHQLCYQKNFYEGQNAWKNQFFSNVWNTCQSDGEVWDKLLSFIQKNEDKIEILSENCERRDMVFFIELSLLKMEEFSSKDQISSFLLGSLDTYLVNNELDVSQLYSCTPCMGNWSEFLEHLKIFFLQRSLLVQKQSYISAQEEVKDEEKQEGVIELQENMTLSKMECNQIVVDSNYIDPVKLQRLSQEGNAKAEKMKNKDAIWFIGGTGSGKSTIINKLLGKKLEEKKIKIKKQYKEKSGKICFNESTETRIYIKGDENEQKKGPVLGHTANSETSEVNFYEYSDQKIGSKILVDTPGYGDSNGVEVDIANQILVYKSVRMCRSVKIVLVLDYHEICVHRGQFIIDTLNIVVSFIKNFEDYMEDFRFFFNKVPENVHSENIKLVLIQLAEQFQKKREKVLENFTRLIIDGLEYNFAKIINPLTDNYLMLWKILHNQQAIENPLEAFQFSISETNIHKISLFVKHMAQKIEQSIENYPYIAEQLDVLCFFKKDIQLTILDEEFDEIQRKVVQNLQEQIQNALQSLRNWVNSKGNLEETEQFEVLKKTIRLVKLFENNRKPHFLQYKGNYETNFMTVVNEVQLKQFKQFKKFQYKDIGTEQFYRYQEQFEEKYESLLKLSALNSQLRDFPEYSQSQNLQPIKNYLHGYIGDISQSVKQKIYEFFSMIKGQEIKNIVNIHHEEKERQNLFQQKIADQIIFLQQSSELYPELDTEVLQNLHKQLQPLITQICFEIEDNLNSEITFLISKGTELQQPQIQSQQKKKKSQQRQEYLTVKSQLLSLRISVSCFKRVENLSEEIKVFYERVIKKIEDDFIQGFNLIKAITELEPHQIVTKKEEDIKPILIGLELIRKLDKSVEDQTIENSFELRKRLQGKIKDIADEIRELIENAEQKSIDFGNLHLYLRIMENFKWMDEYYNEQYIKATLEKVFKFIEKYSETIQQEIQTGLEPIEVQKIDFKDINIKFKKIQQFHYKFKDNPQIDETFKAIEKSIQEKINIIQNKYTIDIGQQLSKDKVCNFNWKILQKITKTLSLLLDLPEQYSNIIDQIIGQIRTKLTNQIQKDHVYLQEMCGDEKFLDRACEQETLNCFNNIKMSEEYSNLISECDEDYNSLQNKFSAIFELKIQEYKKFHKRNQLDYVQINSFYPKLEQISLKLRDHFPNFQANLEKVKDSQDVISEEFRNLKILSMEGNFKNIDPDIIGNLKKIEDQDNNKQYEKIQKIIKDQFVSKARELKSKLQGNNDNLNKLQDKLQEFEVGLHKIYDAKDLFQEQCLNDMEFYNQEQKKVQDLLSKVFLNQFKKRIQDHLENYNFKQMEEELKKCRDLFDSIQHVIQENVKNQYSDMLKSFEDKRNIEYQKGEYRQIQKLLQECKRAEEIASIKYQTIAKNIKNEIKADIQIKLEEIEQIKEHDKKNHEIAQLEKNLKFMKEFYVEELSSFLEEIKHQQKENEENIQQTLHQIISQIKESNDIQQEKLEIFKQQLVEIQQNSKTVMKQFQETHEVEMLTLQQTIENGLKSASQEISLVQDIQVYSNITLFKQFFTLKTRTQIESLKFPNLIFQYLKTKNKDFKKNLERSFSSFRSYKDKDTDTDTDTARTNFLQGSFWEGDEDDFMFVLHGYIYSLQLLKFSSKQDQNMLLEKIESNLETLYENLRKIYDEQEKSLQTDIQLMQTMIETLQKIDNFNEFIKGTDSDYKQIRQNLVEFGKIEIQISKIEKIMKKIKKSSDYKQKQDKKLGDTQNEIKNNLFDKNFTELQKNLQRVYHSQDKDLLQNSKTIIKDYSDKLFEKCQNKMKTENYEKLETNFSLFEELSDKVDSIQGISINLGKEVVKIQEEFKIIINKFENELKQEIKTHDKKNKDNYVSIASKLAQLHNISFIAPSFKQIVRRALENSLQLITTEKINLRHIQGSFNELDDENLIQRGKDIVNSFKTFKKIQLEQYQNQISQLSIKYLFEKFQLMHNFSPQQIQKEAITKYFNIVNTAYKETMNEYLQIHKINQIEKLKGGLISKVKQLDFDTADFNNSQKEKLCKILGVLFGCWSLLDLDKDCFQNEENVVCREPNNNQIVALLLMLGCDTKDSLSEKVGKALTNKKEKLQNQIIQILTGEGKSIIIGISALLFSLLGFQVHVACYSQYLCERDFESFKKVFEFFGVKEKVMYGTFNELSEQILSQDLDLRQAASNLVNGDMLQTSSTGGSRQKNRTVLILDEVDTFFSDNFYGKTYNPAIMVQGTEISELQQAIWEKGKPRDDGESLETPREIFTSIKESQVYKDVLKTHNELSKVLTNHVQEMCQAVCDISSHEYVVEKEQIGYKMADHSICFKTNYKYKTTFVYFKENESGNISDATLEKQMGIKLQCGHLSYAQIPYRYEHIFGVTGTLESLHKDLKDVMKDYNITKQVYVPSMFNKSNIVFRTESTDYFSVEPDQSNWMKKIKDLAVQKTKNEQAVLIFFDSKLELNNFYESSYFAPFKSHCFRITEESKNKDNLIKDSTRSGMISLITKDFGRGTDFICYDDKVQEQGGVAVIHTFLSKDYSEQVQINGRTGRQSQKGSYHLILNADDIQKDFDVLKEDLKKMSEKDNFYGALNQIRDRIYGKIIQNYKKNITKALEKHKDTEQLIEYLKSNQSKDAFELLKQINLKGLQYERSGNSIFYESTHIIFALDESGSMWCKDGQELTRWEHLINAFELFINQKLFLGQTDHIVSVLYHESQARIIAKQTPIDKILTIVKNNDMDGGGNAFYKGVNSIIEILDSEDTDYKNYPKQILFLSDGADCSSWDYLNKSLENLKSKYKSKIQAFWSLGFGSGAETGVLQRMTDVMKDCGGELKTAIDKEQLEEQFVAFSSSEPLQI